MWTRRWLGLSGLLVVLSSLASGCEPERVLAVGLQTDYVAGLEFDAVDVEIDASPAGHRRVGVADSFARPRTVVERSDVAEGLRHVRLTLRHGSTIVARRTRDLRFDGRHLVTIVITRSCEGITCPGAGDSIAATECLGGRCEAPDCGLDGAPACAEPECDASRPCAASGVACVEATCVEGVCLALPRDSACVEGELCLPTTGCVPAPTGDVDAGLDMDAGARRDGGSRDAGPPPACLRDEDCPDEPCADRACVSGVCTTRTRCADTERCCGGDVCALDCVEVRCAGLPAGTVCRAAEGDCDVAEECDGLSPFCPPDGSALAGTACGGGVCDGAGSCGACVEGAPCATGNPCERGEFRCGSGHPECVAAGPATSGTLCRRSAGPCDREERCDGVSSVCPTDEVEPSSTSCRAASGPCEQDARCDGVGTACPPNALRTSGVCRAAGVCDVAESCDGSGPACPPDLLALAGASCPGGLCDGAGACVPASCDVTPGSRMLVGNPFGIVRLGCDRITASSHTSPLLTQMELSTIGPRISTSLTAPALNLSLDVTGTRVLLALTNGHVALAPSSGPVVYSSMAFGSVRWIKQNPAVPNDLWVISTSGVHIIDDTLVGAGRLVFGGFADPNGITFDPATGDAFISDRGSGVARFASAGAISMGPVMPCASPQEPVWSADRSRVYLACEGGEVVELSPTLAVLDRHVVSGAFGLALSSDERLLAVTRTGEGLVDVVAIPDFSLVASFSVSSPRRVTFLGDDRFVAVTAEAGAAVEVFAIP